MTNQVKWELSEVERRYIQGDRIALRALAKLSGHTFDSLCYQSRSNNWVQKREAFQKTLSEQLEKKVIDKLSDQLSEEYSTLLVDHWKSAKKFRDFIDLYLEAAYDIIDETTNESDKKKAIKSIKPIDMNFLSLTLDRAIKGEREALALGFVQNQDAAYNALKDEYVILPRQEFERLMDES